MLGRAVHFGFRLTDKLTSKGKTNAQTDTYHGRFVKLVPDEQVIEVDEFETKDPALRGDMTITITLVEADGHRCNWRSRGTTSGCITCRQQDGLADGTSKPRQTSRGGRARRSKRDVSTNLSGKNATHRKFANPELGQTGIRARI
jgi:hypothetical protein